MKITITKITADSRIVYEEECTIDKLKETRRAMITDINYAIQDLSPQKVESRPSKIEKKESVKEITKPASESQKDYARRLGVSFNDNISAPDLSYLINLEKMRRGEELTGGKKPTPEELDKYIEWYRNRNY